MRQYGDFVLRDVAWTRDGSGRRSPVGRIDKIGTAWWWSPEGSGRVRGPFNSLREAAHAAIDEVCDARRAT